MTIIPTRTEWEIEVIPQKCGGVGADVNGVL